MDTPTLAGNSTMSFDLSIEELLFLLRSLRIRTLLGMGDDPVSGLTEDQVDALADSGVRWAEGTRLGARPIGGHRGQAHHRGSA